MLSGVRPHQVSLPSVTLPAAARRAVSPDSVTLSRSQPPKRPSFWRRNALAIGFMALVGVGMGMHQIGVAVHQAHPIHASASTVSLERERANGERCVASATPVTDPAVQARLDRVAARLAPYEHQEYQVRLNDTHTRNAFACSTGSLFVERDLTKVLDDDELLFVGAHEAGHVELHHAAVKMSYLDQAGWIVNVPIMNAPYVQEFQSMSQQLEKEADCAAVRVLRAEGLGVEVADSALRKTVGDTPQGGSHPLLPERLEAMRHCS